MRYARYLLMAVAALALWTADALASCRWEWDCSGGYPCRQAQVCDSTIDMPAIKPPGISPTPGPSIAPIPQPTIPPIGTSSCRPVRLCDGYGICRWETVCR